MLNESKWPNFGFAIKMKNENLEEKDVVAIDPETAKEELEKTFTKSTAIKIKKDSSLGEIRTAREQAIRDVDWQKSQQLLESANNPKTAFEIYQRLDSRDRFGFDWDSCDGDGRYDFIEKLTEQVAQDPIGFAMLKKEIVKSKLGIIFNFEFIDLDKNFDFMKRIIIKALFKANPGEAGNFAISFLAKLQNKNESSIKKREKWQREMKIEEEMVEYNSQNVHKNKQEIPYEELVSGSEITTAVLYDSFERTVKAIIDNLGEYAAENNLSAQTIDALTDYLAKDHTAFGHSRELTKCFEKTDINYSAQKLLAALRDAETDPWARKLATNILYRLEFGRLSISPEGVKYLERMYDLGEFNNPDYFAKRLTRNGEVGIFNESKELIKYFELGDLSSDQEKIKANVLSFTYKTLFTPRIGESDEEKAQREKVLGEFKQEYFQFFDDRFFQDTGVAFNNFSFREQGQFMNFAENTDRERKNKALEFVRQYGEDGFRSFLSLEYGTETGDKIFDIGEADKERASQIFKDYVRIIDFAEDFYKEITPILEKEAGGQFDRYDFINTMMYGGKKFFDECWSQIKENSEIGYAGILEEIKKERPGLDPKNAAEGILGGAIIELVNQIGLEKARLVLSKTRVAAKDENIKKQIDKALSFIIPPEGAPIHKLNDFYERIKFEDYSYSTHDFEKELLNKFTAKTDKILDLGCGTGRLLIPLKEEYGRDNVMGIDYTGRHVKFVKEKSSDIPVLQGDWTAVGLQGGRFDVIYSLGRNIAHEYQAERQNQLFNEANRLLSTGGKFIIDIPDRTRGHYKKLIDTHAAIMEERGIKKFRKEGLIYDSPDNQSFATRYLYSNEDIEQLAKQSGFLVEAVEEAELNNGYGDVNLYYRPAD